MMVLLQVSCSNSKLNKNIIFDEFRVVNSKIKGDILRCSTWNKEVVIKNLSSDTLIFKKSIKDVSVFEPSIKSGFIYYKYSDKEFHCVNVKTKKVIWEKHTSNKIRNFIFLNDTIGLVDVDNLVLLGVNLRNGQEVFSLSQKEKNKCLAYGVSPFRIVVDSASFYINNWDCSNIVSYNFKGEKRWGRKINKNHTYSILYKNKLILGLDNYYKGGSFCIVNPLDGEVIKTIKDVHFECKSKPVLWNDKLIYYDYLQNSLNKFDITNNTISKVQQFTSSKDKNVKVSNMLISDLFLIKDFIYYHNNLYNFIKIDLNTLEETFICNFKKRTIAAVFIDNNKKVKIIY